MTSKWAIGWGLSTGQKINVTEIPRKISAWMAERADLVLLTSENLAKEMWLFSRVLWVCLTFWPILQGTKISPTVWHFLKMTFLLPRWDMLASRKWNNGKSTTKQMRGNVFLLSVIFTHWRSYFSTWWFQNIRLVFLGLFAQTPRAFLGRSDLTWR